MSDQYFIKTSGDDDYRQVDKAGYVHAERQAGFHNTMGQPTEPATSSFRGKYGVCGRIKYPGQETWVRDYESGIEYVEHLDGVDWFYAPTPPRRHTCTPQTRALMYGRYMERCACGGTRLDHDGQWMERNQRSTKEASFKGRVLGLIRRIL